MFKTGDRVIVSKRPDGSNASIPREFPFEDVIADAGNLRLESGWYVYKDMLSLVNNLPDERDDILYILSLNLSDAIKIAAIKERMGVK